MSSSTPNIGLKWGYNFTFDAKPHFSLTDTSPRILVIGGGVTGLVTAWILLDRGFRVTIISEEWASYGKARRLTSQIAGALWEYPPAVCGSHTNTISLIRSKKWCMTAYRVWEAIAADPVLAVAAGVQMRKSAFFFPSNIEDCPKQFEKLKEMYSSGIREVRRDPKIIHELGINPTCGAIDAYELLVPIIDSDQCMSWLLELVQAKGAKLVTETIHGNLFEQEEMLLARFEAAAIVNATGLASFDLVLDRSCYPLRGALLRFINDGKYFPKIVKAMSISADATDDNEIVFLVPRNDNILVVGGIAQRGEEKLDLNLDSPIIQRMQDRCVAFLPALKNARLDPEYPLAQGLRPCREENIRVERELRRHESPRGAWQSRVFHSYGHGGSGWSLSFGCAEEIAALIEEVVSVAKTQSRL